MSLSLLAGFSAYHGIRYVFFPPKRNVVIKMEPLEYKELEKFKDNFPSIGRDELNKKLEYYSYLFAGFYHMNYLLGKDSLKVKEGYSSRKLKGLCLGKVNLPENVGQLEELLANNEVLVDLKFFSGSLIPLKDASGRLKREKKLINKIHFIKNK
jgi:hypothetical protein